MLNQWKCELSYSEQLPKGQRGICGIWLTFYINAITWTMYRAYWTYVEISKLVKVFNWWVRVSHTFFYTSPKASFFLFQTSGFQPRLDGLQRCCARDCSHNSAVCRNLLPENYENCKHPPKSNVIVLFVHSSGSKRWEEAFHAWSVRKLPEQMLEIYGIIL